MINTDIEMTAHAADKYDMKEFMDLLCFKMKAQAEDLKNEFIADGHVDHRRQARLQGASGCGPGQA